MKTAPVSAVMTAYNAEAFIGEALDSVRAQTLPVAEIIVVDDGSSDRTAEIGAAKGARVIQQPHAGLSAGRNRCVREAVQPWIAFIDADDLWEPKKIERQIQIAESDSALVLLTSDYLVFDQSGVICDSTLQKYGQSYRRQPKTNCPGGTIIEGLHESFTDISYLLVPSFVMVSKQAIEAVGGFDETLFVAEDFDCFMRVLALGKFGVCESVQARRREHSSNASRHFEQTSLSCLAATYKVLQNPDDYPAAAVALCRQWLPANLRHAGARLVEAGDMSRGRELLLKSARLKFSWRTMLALTASLTPRALGRELMKARYKVSDTWGV